VFKITKILLVMILQFFSTAQRSNKCQSYQWMSCSLSELREAYVESQTKMMIFDLPTSKNCSFRICVWGLDCEPNDLEFWNSLMSEWHILEENIKPLVKSSNSSPWQYTSTQCYANKDLLLTFHVISAIIMPLSPSTLWTRIWHILCREHWGTEVLYKLLWISH
jgi:hypothetical protein